MEEKHHNDVKQPPSRGVPSKESLWLSDVRKLRDEWHYHKNVRLELDQVLALVFPPQYQAKYHEIALLFMKTLLHKTEMRGADLGTFLKDNNFSKATFYNIILPRLKRVGMIKTEREQYSHDKSKQKFYRKIVRPSTQFSVFWRHIAEEYESIVETAKARGGE